ncbi:MAG: GAF domain-containing protein [Geitlerinemataceae cyanobacterium]
MIQPKQQTEYGQKLIAIGLTLQTLREANTLEVLLETTFNYLKTECQYDLIWVGAYDRTEHKLIGRGGKMTKGDFKILRQAFSLSPGDLMEQVVVQQRPVAVADLREEVKGGDWRKIAKQCEIQGAVIFPLRYRNLCLGAILLGSQHWGISTSSEEKAQLSIVFGELAATWAQLQLQRQNLQAKRPQEVLLSLLGQLRSLTRLDDYLDLLVAETHHCLQPSRTHIYWYDRDRGLFWRRATNRAQLVQNRGNSKTQEVEEIRLPDINGFYQMLLENRAIAMSESNSALKVDATGRLMRLLKARSLLAAPIFNAKELVGFVSLEGKEPRVWQEEDKHWLRGVAGLAGLALPLSQMEETIGQIQLDGELRAGLTQAISSQKDWKTTLAHCAEKLATRLNVQRCFFLLHDRDRDRFEIVYQNYPPTRQPVESPLPILSLMDWRLLETARDPIGIENWLDSSARPYSSELDVRFSAWRDSFTEVGVRSLLVCNTHLGHPLEGVLAVAGDTPRVWTHAERELLATVSQQMGLILHQWQLQRQTEQQQQIIQTLQWGLTQLEGTEDEEQFEKKILRQIARVLQVPLAALVTWQPGRPQGRVSHEISSHPGLKLDRDRAIFVHHDALIQKALSASGLVGPVSLEELPQETADWLGNRAIQDLRVIALQTSPEQAPTGVAIVADLVTRHWTNQELELVNLLVAELARSRRTAMVTQKLLSRKRNMEILNWYKHNLLEELCRTASTGTTQLNQLDLFLVGNDNDDSQSQSLQQMRYQQTLQQLANSLSSLNQFLHRERWKIALAIETFSIAGLLKRAMDRVEPVRNQRQIWMKVSREGHFSIRGDRQKLEFIFAELLMVACGRTENNGRIQIAYRPLPPEATTRSFPLLELSIVDWGKIEPRAIEAYHQSRKADLLMSSYIDRPPGLNLIIYQQLLQKMGGDFNFYRLEDGRVVSQIIIPLAPSI